MDKQTLFTSSPEETTLAASQLAKTLSPGSVICLEGDLGAGKTTFVKGVAGALGVLPDLITSPTFVYLNTVDTFAHFDLYRIPSLEHFVSMGFDEYLEPPFVTFVEWPEIISPILPAHTILVKLEHKGENQRTITFQSPSMEAL